MLIAAMFTVAKTRTQHTCPLTDERADSMVYTGNGILVSLQKRKPCRVSTSVNLEDVMHRGMSEGQILHNDTSMRNLQ